MSHALRTIVKNEVQKILDHFCYCFDVRILLYTPQGEILRVGMNRPDSPFCLLVRRLYGEQRCLTLDDTMRHRAAESAELVCYTCHAGLGESVEPIFVRDVLVGYAMIGQFRTGNTIAGHVLRDWKAKHPSSAELEEAFRSLPSYDDESQSHIIGLFRLLVEYVVSKELISLDANLLMERINSYVRNNVHRSFMLNEVARALGRSPSTISHTVHHHTGGSFKQLYSEAKITEAERLMTSRPDMPLSEIAERVGYSDQFYFSRVYRKIRGCPPSQFSARTERPQH